MIPKYVMPQTMQNFANISPMSWALDGFLEVILPGETLVNVLDYIGILIGFGLLSFAIAVTRFKRLSGYYG